MEKGRCEIRSAHILENSQKQKGNTREEATEKWKTQRESVRVERAFLESPVPSSRPTGLESPKNLRPNCRRPGEKGIHYFLSG